MLVLLVAAAALSWAAPDRPFAAQPPPGWEDGTPERADADVLVALKGPETSSFALTRVPRMHLENRAAVRGFLADVLEALNRRTGLAFVQSSAVQSASYDNGLTFLYVTASLDGKPRLVLGVAEFGGETVLGTLISAVPDMLMPAILGGLRARDGGRAGPGRGSVQSGDGQLLFALPAGVSSRELTERERKMGFVLALKGLDTELMVLKVVEEPSGGAPKDQPLIVKQTVLGVPDVDAASLSEAELLDTPPGPDLVYAWAKVADPAASRFLAGYMPWGYWGYSILAKGADPVGLLGRSFSTLALGPSALPKVVAATRPIPVPRRLRLRKKKHLLAAGAGAALVLVLGLWAFRPRKS